MTHPLSEQYRIVAKSWVEANKVASLLEETKSARLSQMKKALGDIPDSRAETTVKASPEWTALVSEMIEARSKSNLLMVQMAYIKMRAAEQASSEASARAEMRL